MTAAIAPYVAQARASYPGARLRFLQGLPAGQRFFVTTRLHDDGGRLEQVFILVHRVEGGEIQGVIQNNIDVVKGFQRGQSYRFPESELLDWTITHSDGREEGNVVGKFLDTYHASAAASGGVELSALAARIKELAPTWKSGGAAAINLLKEDTQKRVSLLLLSEAGMETHESGMQFVQSYGEHTGSLLIVGRAGLRVGHHACKGTMLAVAFTLTKGMELGHRDTAWTKNGDGWCELDIYPGNSAGDIQGKLRAKVVLNGGDGYYNIEAGYFYVKAAPRARGSSPTPGSKKLEVIING
jgi:uncharacterized protein YegJ (DUF2314 family)